MNGMGRRVVIGYKVIREISDRYHLSKVPKEEGRATCSYVGAEHPVEGTVSARSWAGEFKEQQGAWNSEKRSCAVRAEDECGQITSRLVCMVGFKILGEGPAQGLSRELTWPQSSFQRIPLTEK